VTCILARHQVAVGSRERRNNGKLANFWIDDHTPGTCSMSDSAPSGNRGIFLNTTSQNATSTLLSMKLSFASQLAQALHNRPSTGTDLWVAYSTVTGKWAFCVQRRRRRLAS
jgi:hypothetical protein